MSAASDNLRDCGLVAMGITHSDTGCSLCKARAVIARAEGQP